MKKAPKAIILDSLNAVCRVHSRYQRPVELSQCKVVNEMQPKLSTQKKVILSKVIR